MDQSLVPTETIIDKIHLIRGQKVLLDSDLAALYHVATKTLVQAVSRNARRFPDDFMFRLTPEEFSDLRAALGGNGGWGGRRYPPWAFTEQGVAIAMLNFFRRMTDAVEVRALDGEALAARLPAEQAAAVPDGVLVCSVEEFESALLHSHGDPRPRHTSPRKTPRLGYPPQSRRS